MTRKVISHFCWVFSLLELFSTSAQASNGFEGLFGGISAGATYTSGKFQNSTSATFLNSLGGGPFNTALKDNHTSNKIRPEIGFTLGYSRIFENWYLGGELGVLTQNKVTRQVTTPFAFPASVPAFNGYLQSFMQAKSSGEVNLDVTPGGLINDKLLAYARIGVAVNRFRYDVTTNFFYVNNTGTVPTLISLPSTTKKTKAGLRVGVGISQYLSENLLLNASYTYTYYGRISNYSRAGMRVNPFLVSQGLVSNSNVRLSRHSLMIGLNYYFKGIFD